MFLILMIHWFLHHSYHILFCLWGRNWMLYKREKGLVNEIQKVACSSDGQVGSLSKWQMVCKEQILHAWKLLSATGAGIAFIPQNSHRCTWLCLQLCLWHANPEQLLSFKHIIVSSCSQQFYTMWQWQHKQPPRLALGGVTGWYH